MTLVLDNLTSITEYTVQVKVHEADSHGGWGEATGTPTD